MRVRPVLANNCYACHTDSKLGGLRVDSLAALLQGGKSGPAVVPGKPDESPMIQAVRRTHARLKMPPAGKLPDSDIEDLTAWVKLGAVWPEAADRKLAAPKTGEYAITAEQRAFWAFRPVLKPSVPEPKNRAWSKTSIDRFILAKLEREGLKPVDPADKRTLIRRATFDLVGLPPTPEEVRAFEADSSPLAFPKVVDRLLASPQYGERWARHWLDQARYADGSQEDVAKPMPHSNAFRYRDWVIQAFNADMPYDAFVKAQIAGDLLGDKKPESSLAGLGFQALGTSADDQVDVTTRTFLGLTVACARCHDHKYDPIPARDYYSLAGVFKSSTPYQYPLAPEESVKTFKDREKNLAELKESIDDFVQKQSTQLADVLASKTSSYFVAAWKGTSGAEEKLDKETLARWVRYLKEPKKDHPYLKAWFDAKTERTPEQVKKFTEEFQSQLLAVIAAKKEVDDKNYVILGGAKGVNDYNKRLVSNLVFLDVDKYYLWRDMCSEPYKKGAGGIYYYGEKEIGRFLHVESRDYLESKIAAYDAMKKAMPPPYPALDTIKDSDKPANLRVAIRGDLSNPGEEAPRRFLRILSNGDPAPFTRGSGRLELAESIANPKNPLTARVIVNRIWEHHFGQGLVATPGNFGQLGDRPTHPELLDYLAGHFIEGGWSIKKLHREIILSATYQLSGDHSPESYAKDPANRLHWRANMIPRLDAESLRDSLLAVAGNLDLKVGGPAEPLTDDNRRRTIYGTISRTRVDPMLTLFDFPDPNATADHRLITGGPMQRLFFLNSSFVAAQSKALVERLQRDAGPEDAAKIARAYSLLFGRPAARAEMELGLEFLKQSGGSWPQYAQILLSSNEFSSVN